MKKLIPFKAWRYNPKKIPDVTVVVSPPYDVIDAGLRQQLSARSPYNVVQIDLPNEAPPDDKYQAAGKIFQEWKQNGVLQQDSTPGLYLYFQTYALPDGRRLTRKGFFARRRLEAFSEGGIKPHEKTFAGPKQDRYQLMEATQAQLSPIFALYSDPQKITGPQLDAWAEGDPLVHIRESHGDEHRLWRVEATPELENFLAKIQDHPLLIADGHHRYETALTFCQDRRAELGNKATGEEDFNFVLMYLCSLEDPGLVILPTHRVLTERPEGDMAIWKRLLGEVGTLRTYPVTQLQEVLELMRAEGTREHLIAWVHDAAIELIQFDPEKVLQSPGLSHLHFALRDLDVTLLHDLVLAEFMGIPKGAQREYGRIKYIQDPAEVLRLVQEKNTFGFILNPTKMGQVQAITDIGETMPQKSTFFYPKLLTGLVFNQI